MLFTINHLTYSLKALIIVILSSSANSCFFKKYDNLIDSNYLPKFNKVIKPFNPFLYYSISIHINRSAE